MMDSEKIIQLRELTAADPGDALGWFMLGTALVQTGGGYSEAVEALEKCIALNPGHTAAYRWLGDAWRKAGEAEKAISTYRAAISKADETGDLQVAKEARAFLALLESGAA